MTSQLKCVCVCEDESARVKGLLMLSVRVCMGEYF